MNSGDAETAQPIDETFACIVSVRGAQFGLNGCRQFELHLIVRLIKIAGETNYRARINQAWSYNPGAQNPVAVWDSDCARSSDLLNLTIARENHAVANYLASHCIDCFA